MMKKLFSFICCLMPFGMGAANAADAIVVETGAGYNVDASGLNVADMKIGNEIPETPAQDTFYAGPLTSKFFTIDALGNVDVINLLEINENWNFSIRGKEADVGGAPTLVNASFGLINAAGGLDLHNIDALTITNTLTAGVGVYSNGTLNITKDANLAIAANSITAGAITVYGGAGNTIAATNDFTTGSLVNYGGKLTVSAGSMGASNAVGEIQNVVGTMNIALGGNLNVQNNLENSDNMVIERQNSSDTVNVVVSGTMKNDSNSGTLTLNGDNLTVNGGDALNPSFVNKGNLSATVSGATTLAHGFDITSMGASNVFNLTTGTLDVNNTNLQLTRGTFALTVNNGGINFGTISNDGNMTLAGKSVNASSISNSGTMNANTTTDGDIIVAGAITSSGDTSETTITAAGALSAGAITNNGGIMDLNGNTVSVLGAGVTNNGRELRITGLTSQTGGVNIVGNVSNLSNGDIYINARDIKIGGTIANGTTTNNNVGNITIAGSDTAGGHMQIGQMDIYGGIVKINALAGGIGIDKSLNVIGGALNIDGATHELTVAETINIDGDVNVAATPVIGAGNVNIAASGPQKFVMKSTGTDTNGVIEIDGNVSADATGAARSAAFVAQTINVGKNITAKNSGALVFGDADTTKLTVGGNITANDGGTVEIYAADTDAASISGDGKIIAHGNQITATDAGGIQIANGLWFGPDSSVSNPMPQPAQGMVVLDTNVMAMETTASGANIDFGGYMLVGGGKSLTMQSAADVIIGGNVYSQGTTRITANNNASFNNDINNSDTLRVFAQTITADDADITNTGEIELNADAFVNVGAISSSNDLTISAGTTTTAGAIDITGGVADITAKSLEMALMNITGGVVNLNSAQITANTTANAQGVNVSGNLMQGGAGTGMLNLTQNNTVLTANNLTVGGDFLADSNAVDYVIGDAVDITGDVNVLAMADTDITAKTIRASDVNNAGDLALRATDEMNLGIIENSGRLIIGQQNNAIVNATRIVDNAGTIVLNGRELNLTGGDDVADSKMTAALNTSGVLYQMFDGALSGGDINVASNDYTITTSNLTVGAIDQKLGSLVVNTSDISIGGNVDALDLRFVANSVENWMNVGVGGDVSGGVQFIGLEHMQIDGNYMFNDNSAINAAILPYAAGVSPNTTTTNYWSRVSLNDDNTLGQITNADDGGALIQVNGVFQSDLSLMGDTSNGVPLKNGQIGLTLRDIVDQGTAIWFVHADKGIADLGTKIRNLNVNFCNADGSMCFNYLDSLDGNNGADDNLPAYISVRDSNGDGTADSLYVVFDPRFGGPVEVFKIQPVVAREPDHTNGEYVSAGALDNLIAGQLQNTGFYNKTPIEAIPVVFRGTNMEQMSQELYNRMEYYNLERDGVGLARFSRLFQVRELEQIAGAVSLNEHTNFRSFEDRMFDEFIWNRNRNLKKAWVDVEYGMFNQDVDDNKTIDGNRFNIAGGFDWQESQTLILGLTGRVSHMSSENSDAMNLGYRPDEFIAGHVKTKVADTDIGLGGYLMKTLGDKTRLYGNAFLDIHWFDVSRDQNFMSSIDGDGTAFALTSEWGLLHDWLNQYIVGNAYARVGYNTGFSITEQAAGHDYMKMESDGYMILTPGYSLTAQKRIYPSAWFQIRPYATIGIEYDVLGAPDEVKYKFAYAHSFTDFDINIDPLWANIGAGVELLSATGIQVGLDYRYQYNADIQLHNIKISGSYRF